MPEPKADATEVIQPVNDNPSPAPPAVEPQPPEPIEPQPFDPAKFDANDAEAVASLSEEDFAKLNEHLNAPPEGNEPEPTPAKDTEGEDTSKAKGTPAPNEPTPTKLAGKYSSFDELAKGVEQLAGKLGKTDDPAIKALIDVARETGKHGKVEEVYKTLETELGRRAAASAPPAKEPVITDTPLTTEEEAKMLGEVSSYTLQQLHISPLSKMFRDRGLEMPKDAKEFEALVDTQPFLAIEFKRAFEEGLQGNLKIAKEHISAQKSVTSQNEASINADVQAIKGLAESNAIPLSDEEIAAVKERVLQDGDNFVERYGVRFVRKGALLREFAAEVLPKKIADVRQNSLAQGREQAMKDVAELQRKTPKSVSSAKIPAATALKRGKIDENDPDAISKMTDEELARYGLDK